MAVIPGFDFGAAPAMSFGEYVISGEAFSALPAMSFGKAVIKGVEFPLGDDPPAIPPTIAIVSPAEGFVLNRTTPIIFTVVADQASVSLRRVVVSALLGGNIVEETVHEGVAFAAPYNGGSNARAVITHGYQFTLLRIGGWRGSSVTLRIIAVDVFGNLAQKTLAVPQALYTWPIAFSE